MDALIKGGPENHKLNLLLILVLMPGIIPHCRSSSGMRACVTNNCWVLCHVNALIQDKSLALLMARIRKIPLRLGLDPSHWLWCFNTFTMDAPIGFGGVIGRIVETG